MVRSMIRSFLTAAVLGGGLAMAPPAAMAGNAATAEGNKM